MSRLRFTGREAATAARVRDRALELRLREQNTGSGWLDCAAHGLRHRWRPPAVVRSAYGTAPASGEPSISRGCARCPVRILSVPQGTGKGA